MANGAIVNPGIVSLNGIAPDSGAALLQLRVWENSGGFATNFWSAQASGEKVGGSPTFKVSNIGGQIYTAPYLQGLQSFAIPLIGGTIPEPSTAALLAMGGVGILLYQKRARNLGATAKEIE